MRQVCLVAFGILLLALAGALCRILHAEWIHPDPVLLLDVFLALYLPPVEGVLSVFFLGVFSDSFAGTPMGMLATIHLLVWMVVRWSKQYLMPDERLIQLGITFAASLLFSLLTLVMLKLVQAGSGVRHPCDQRVWINLKAMLPIGLLHALLAAPVWALARWIRRPASQPRTLGAF